MPSYTFTPSILRGAGTRAVPEIPVGSSFSNTYSLSFDGTDDEVVLDSTAVFTDEFSISLWFKIDSIVTNKNYVLGNGSSSSNWIHMLSVSSIRVKVSSNTVTLNESGGNTWNLGSWNHALICRDSNSHISVFINGSQFSTTATSGTGGLPSQTLTLSTFGRRGNFHLLGGMDEVAFWTSNQSSNLSTIYNEGVPGDLTSLSPSGWWRFEEGSGTTATDSAGSNNGTITGATYSTNVPA